MFADGAMYCSFVGDVKAGRRRAERWIPFTCNVVDGRCGEKQLLKYSSHCARLAPRALRSGKRHLAERGGRVTEGTCSQIPADQLFISKDVFIHLSLASLPFSLSLVSVFSGPRTTLVSSPQYVRVAGCSCKSIFLMTFH